MAFLAPLCEVMTSHDPSLRPTLEDAVGRFHELVSQLSGRDRRWRLVLFGERGIRKCIKDVESVWREAKQTPRLILREFLTDYSCLRYLIPV